MWTGAAAAAISLGGVSGPSYCRHCTPEEIGCSTSYAVASHWIKSPFKVQKVSDHSGISFRYKNAFFGVGQFHWLPDGHDNCLFSVSVAADYSDSVPGSSNYAGHKGYHPLEELREHRMVRDTKLTAAEIARTTLKANHRALLLFPGTVHCEPHEKVSWADLYYFTDGSDIYVMINDAENILLDREAIKPVNALIGMDIPQYENRRTLMSDYNIIESGSSHDISFQEYLELEEFATSSKMVESLDWGMPDGSSWSCVHPIYFAKCLTKAVDAEHVKMMYLPTNGVSIFAYLDPCFDEDLYREVLEYEIMGNTLDWDDEDWSSSGNKRPKKPTIYRLEPLKIELFSVYGVQSSVSLHDFQVAKPDILVHSTRAIIRRFEEQGMRCNFALRSLCKKKGLHAEGACLIGIDSLGLDVRVFSGSEVRTHRFPFKVRATTEAAAEKQIQQLLFPRSQRKKLNTHGKQRDFD